MGVHSANDTSLENRSWPLQIRSGALVRMLEHTGTPYERITERVKMAEVCTTWSGEGDTFAPPVLDDDGYKISQSVAATMYLAHKLGLEPPGFDEFKAIQYCLDMTDAFELGFGKNHETGEALKAYVEGPRWRALLTNLERGIQVWPSSPCGPPCLAGSVSGVLPFGRGLSGLAICPAQLTLC